MVQGVELMSKKQLQFDEGTGHIDPLAGKILTASLDENLTMLKEFFADDDTLRIREIKSPNGERFASIYCDGLINSEIINEHVVKPLMTRVDGVGETMEALLQKTVRVDSFSVISSWSEIAKGITSLLIPKMNAPALILRYVFLLLSSLFGIFGLILGLTGLLIHLLNLKTLGIPQLLPNGEFLSGGFKDTFWRAPWTKMKTRPEALTKNRIRMKINED